MRMIGNFVFDFNITLVSHTFRYFIRLILSAMIWYCLYQCLVIAGYWPPLTESQVALRKHVRAIYCIVIYLISVNNTQLMCCNRWQNTFAFWPFHLKLTCLRASIPLIHGSGGLHSHWSPIKISFASKDYYAVRRSGLYWEWSPLLPCINGNEALGQLFRYVVL